MVKLNLVYIMGFSVHLEITFNYTSWEWVTMLVDVVICDQPPVSFISHVIIIKFLIALIEIFSTFCCGISSCSLLWCLMFYMAVTTLQLSALVNGPVYRSTSITEVRLACGKIWPTQPCGSAWEMPRQAAEVAVDWRMLIYSRRQKVWW